MDSKEKDPRNFSLAEWQQAKRVGRDPKQAKALIQECWAASGSRSAFEKALQERGLYLARGDRRAHVAVTYEGEVLSIARTLGKKTNEVTARLGPPDQARSVEEAKAYIAEAVAPRLKSLIEGVKLARAVELSPLHERRNAMKLHHTTERQRLDENQQDRAVKEAKMRSARLRGGVMGVWDRLTGRHGRTVKQNEAEALVAMRRDRAERDGLVSGQLVERRALQRDIMAVRHRYAASVLELHRDLDRRAPGQDASREGLRDSFADASRGDRATPSLPRRILRGRSNERNGPDLGR